MTNYYIGVSNGLLRDGHRKRMGEAVWEFMWLIDRVTRIDAEQRGYVLGGKPIQLSEIATGLGVHKATVSRNLSRLQAAGYISITHAPYGLIIVVQKAKKRFNRPATRMNISATRYNRNVKPNIRQYSMTDTKTEKLSAKNGEDPEYEEIIRKSKLLRGKYS